MVKLRKSAKKSKRAVNLKKIIKPSRSRTRKISAQAKSPVTKKEELGMQELKIEQSKFYSGQMSKLSRRNLREELPSEYGQDKLVLLVRDPWWIYAYWELTSQTLDKIKKELGAAFSGARHILRVYDISNIIFNGNNAHRFFDIQVNEYANNWYIDTAGPGRSWCVDLGLLLSDGRFIKILRSNTVQTPLDGPSWITDEEWMIPDDMFSRLYGMGFGFGQSSAVGKKNWQHRGVLASPGMASMSSPVKKMQGARKFWFSVNTELIVYGATEPDAKVSVQGRPIKLRPDGTFTLRFALPDGRQVIPVQAVSSDIKEEKIITPIVTRETR